MAKDKTKLIKMECTVCHELNYRNKKNRNIEGRLELKKFCNRCGKHTLHKETK